LAIGYQFAQGVAAMLAGGVKETLDAGVPLGAVDSCAGGWLLLPLC